MERTEDLQDASAHIRAPSCLSIEPYKGLAKVTDYWGHSLLRPGKGSAECKGSMLTEWEKTKSKSDRAE